MQAENFQLLRPEDMARMLNVAKVTAYQWARRGVLPRYRFDVGYAFRSTSFSEDTFRDVEAICQNQTNFDAFNLSK